MWDVVFASHTAQTGVFRVGSHHYARELAEAGCEVTHVSTGLTPLHLSRIRGTDVRSRLRMALNSPVTDAQGVKHVVPLLGFPTGRLPEPAADAVMRLPLRSWCAALGRDRNTSPDFLIVDQPLLGGMIEILKPKRIIYRPTDAHFDVRTRQAEMRVVAKAHGVVATSKSVLDEVLAGAPQAIPTEVLENGVEFERFSEAPESGPRAGAIYVGALDKRFDWRTLQILAHAFPMEPFSVAGPVPSSKPVELPSNVRFLGPVPYAEIPQLLKAAKVGLLPMSDDPSNGGRSPMKYYEYLAAGLNIVATRTETLAERTGPGVYLYERSGDPVPAMLSALANYNGNSSGIAYASEYSWKKRSQRLMKFMQETGD